ncbi:MAG: helix-turn-helix domain-containing protein [Thermoplasmata archaeon]|nr:helix-turn-helix domain-containing protein [Thermoplasmata archaeon]
MVKGDVRVRLQVVRPYLERGTRTAEVCRVFGISEATLRRWCRNYREEGVEGLRYKSRRPHLSPNRIHGNIANRILQLRRRHPSWEAMRIYAGPRQPRRSGELADRPPRRRRPQERGSVASGNRHAHEVDQVSTVSHAEMVREDTLPAPRGSRPVSES